MKLMKAIATMVKILGVVLMTFSTLGATEAPYAGCDDEGDLWDTKVTKQRTVYSYEPYWAEVEFNCYICVVPGNGWSLVYSETFDAEDEDLVPSKDEWAFFNCQL